MNEVKFRPRMRFFHSNSKGTGCALSLELVPAIGNDEGCIMATFANQASVGNLQGTTPVYPKFDWERALTVKLGFEDICKMQQVFRGECESVGDGKGLFHGKSNAYAVITLRHIIEPSSGYMLGVRRLYADGKEARATIVLSSWEALGISEAITASMSVICFGAPVARARTEKPTETKHEAA